LVQPVKKCVLPSTASKSSLLSYLNKIQ
jgi:hypothetical protein